MLKAHPSWCMETDYILQHFIKCHVCIDIFQLMLQGCLGTLQTVPMHVRLEPCFREQWAPAVLQTPSLAGAQPLVLMCFSGEGQRAPLPFAQCLGRAPGS